MEFLDTFDSHYSCVRMFENNIVPDTDFVLYEITGWEGDADYSQYSYVLMTTEEAKNFNTKK